MTRIVCLANSFKTGGRCIAGIDSETNRWIRPIGRGDEGAIGSERLIDGAEPKLLDILEIPIGGNADDLGCQPENRVLRPGPWRKVGEVEKNDVMQYTEDTNRLFHNFDKKVPLSEFESNIQRADWKSLQLIHVTNARFSKNPWNNTKTECNFFYSGHWYLLKAPCPDAEQYIGSKADYILTVSLGGPFRRKPQDDLCCWKMVAGAIRL